MVSCRGRCVREREVVGVLSALMLGPSIISFIIVSLDMIVLILLRVSRLKFQAKFDHRVPTEGEDLPILWPCYS